MKTCYRVSNSLGSYCFIEAESADDAKRIACQMNMIPCHHWQDLTATAA